MPRIIPVIDVMDGVVVHGIGGRRENYQPIRSSIVDSTEPLKVAEAMLAKTGSREIYVADLDAIRGDGRVSPHVLDCVHRLDATVWLDSGSRRVTETRMPNNVRRILATETLVPTAVPTRSIPGDCIFSIDVSDRGLLCDWRGWGLNDPFDYTSLVSQVINTGILDFIILPIGSVGRNNGLTALPVCETLTQQFPTIRVITGGGIRSMRDIEEAGRCGVDAVLVASAIHSGALNNFTAGDGGDRAAVVEV